MKANIFPKIEISVTLPFVQCPHQLVFGRNIMSSLSLNSYSFPHWCPRPRARSISSLSQVAAKCSANSSYNFVAFSSPSFQEHNICRALNSQLYFTPHPTPHAQTHYNSSQKKESWHLEFLQAVTVCRPQNQYSILKAWYEVTSLSAIFSECVNAAGKILWKHSDICMQIL